MRIRCITTFDITATGVRSNFNANRIPFQDAAGTPITDIQQWTRSRNQQRNWETINQLISLRCLPSDITMPEKITHDGVETWSFEFDIEDATMIASADHELGSLKSDCNGIPMIMGLDETANQTSCLDPDHNIVFEVQSR
jgi:hypothetical protein